jgi:NAD(P)-dependent dehydrogenase (short-subunit alcohol dehydrogenase family)
VASLALFLASERAGFINGQSIGLNGGLVPY